jgi:uncharacterized protein YprB with RNaseH-like and TPR domain
VNAGTDEDIAKLCGGAVVAPMLIEVSRRYALPLVRGSGIIPDARALVEGARLSATHGHRIDAQQLLLLDTETSGLAGGTGTVAFLVGLASVSRETLCVRQFLMTGFGAERSMLERVHSLAPPRSLLVTFNGKSFDIPLLKTRARLAGIESPYDSFAHLDLLHVTRRRLRLGWPDCRLRTAEERVLGLWREHDLPGSAVPEAWRRWLQARVAAPLADIVEHNRQDLLSLAALLAVLAEPTQREAPLLWRSYAERRFAG